LQHSISSLFPYTTLVRSLDECILLEIYPARELPIEGITSTWLLSKMKLQNKKLMTKEEVLKEIAANKKEVILTMGAGNIDTLVRSEEHTSELQSRENLVC